MSIHDYTTGALIHLFIIITFLTGHKKYLGFLLLYSTYNNAVVHVFIRLLINSKGSSSAKADRSAAPEATFSDDKGVDDIKETDHDIELIGVEPVDRHCAVPSNSHTGEYNSKLLTCGTDSRILEQVEIEE